MLQGYKGVWGDNGTLLTCHPASHQAPTAIIVGVVAAAAVLIIALLAWWQYLTTRPRWLRERILQVGVVDCLCLAPAPGHYLPACFACWCCARSAATPTTASLT